MRRPHLPSGLLLLGALSVLAAASACARDAGPPTGPAGSDRHLKPDAEFIAGTVPPSATLATLLKSHRVRDDRIQSALDLIARTFDPRRLKAKQPYRLIRAFDGALRGFEYEIDLDRCLRVAPRSPAVPADLTAEVITYRRELAVAKIAGRIDRDTSSLFAAMAAVGESDELSIELAGVFSGEIDFNSELQPGDTFRMAFEKVTRETGTISYGNVLTAEFRNGGRTLRAFRFALPDGKFGYYDEHGRSLRRFFLKSPLKFEPRITSRFSYSRLHPVLNVRRAHLGVDFAAPVGAAVNAVANGVVTRAGNSGEAGLMVAIRHPSGFESMYLHLSSIPVRVGQHVSQGELVGRVGSSGLATGPHLDYRLKKNGVYVNPLAIARSMPPGEPLPAQLTEHFTAERDRLLGLLPTSSAANVTSPPSAQKPTSFTHN